MLLLTAMTVSAQDAVTVTQTSTAVTMSNGIISLKIGSNGRVSELKKYINGNLSANLMGDNGIYFDYTADKNAALNPSGVEVVKQTDDYAEVLFSNTSDDLRFQQGYIMRRGVSGVYVYVIANGTPNSSAVQLKEARVCTRLASTFLNGYVDETMQGTIPSNKVMADVEQNAVVTDATYKLPDGSIYTKYNWAQYVVNDSVHGLMNSNYGVWNIACSHEWINGGPMKQELTVHATSKSPITIQMIQGEHLGASAQYYEHDERKLYGPFLIYVNRTSNARHYDELIADAKQMAHQQQQEWPFQWFENELYPRQRSTVSGRLNVTTGQGAEGVEMLLAEAGTDPYLQGKGYMFWTRTDANGRFAIRNVRPGNYMLYGYATRGDVTDELQHDGVSVSLGEDLDLGTIDWTPIRLEHKLFQIGENNRRADGFHWSDTCRLYELPEMVPATLTYTVGKSDPAIDWYYAQTKTGTWTVRFDCSETYTGKARLTASLAAVTSKPNLKVTVNGSQVATWSWDTNDGSIYRSATQSGRHDVKVVEFDASKLKVGTNTVAFNLTNGNGRKGVMYDCIKLEAGAQIVNGISSAQLSADGRFTLYNMKGQLMGTFNSLAEARLPKGIYVSCQDHQSRKVVIK